MSMGRIAQSFAAPDKVPPIPHSEPRRPLIRRSRETHIHRWMLPAGVLGWQSGRCDTLRSAYDLELSVLGGDVELAVPESFVATPFLRDALICQWSPEFPREVLHLKGVKEFGFTDMEEEFLERFDYLRL